MMNIAHKQNDPTKEQADKDGLSTCSLDFAIGRGRLQIRLSKTLRTLLGALLLLFLLPITTYAQTGAISGAVTNSNSDPLENIHVTVYRYDTEYEYWSGYASDYTDANGNYDVDGLAEGTYRIGFWDSTYTYLELFHENAQNVDSATDVSIDADTTVTVDATLQPASHIVGTVTNNDSTPLENIYVTVYRYNTEYEYWESFANAYTIVNGNYDVGGLAEGTYRVRFYDTAQGNYILLYHDNAADVESATDVVVGAGATVTVHATLQPAAHIVGNVTNSDSVPLAGVQVNIYRYNVESEHWSDFAYSYTDANGNYDVGSLAAGTYRVSFYEGSGEYHYWQYYPNTFTVDEATDVVVGNEATVTVDMTLVRRSYLVGTVIDTLSNPAVGVTVRLYNWHTPLDSDPYWGSISSVDTDENGQYEFDGIVAGTYRIGFEDYAGNYLPLYHENATDIDNATDVNIGTGVTATVDATLPRASHIVGTVISNDGTPLEGISVSAYRYDTEYESWSGPFTYTDADGNYDIGGLVEGTYRIGFWDSTYTYLELFHENAPNIDSATDVNIGADATVTVDATLQRASHIVGTVLSNDSTPLEDISVTVYRYNTESEYWSSFAYAYTDANGNYDVGGLVEGTYRVGFWDNTYTYLELFHADAQNVDSATDVNIGAGATVTVDATLQLASHIVGTVISSDSTPLENIRITIYRYNTEYEYWEDFAYADTDANGNYDVGGLVGGTYRIGFWDSTYTYLELFHANAQNVDSATDVNLGTGATITVDTTLQLASHIVGTVINNDGAPLENISVTIYHYDAEYEYWSGFASAYTDANGNYDVGGLVGGTYRVGFHDAVQGNYIPLYHLNAQDVDSATDVVVGAASTATVNATLQAASHIVGTVTNGDGTPLEQASITVYRYLEESGYWSSFAYGYADANGNYHVGGLAAGTYRVGFYEGSGEYIYWQYYPNVMDVYAATNVEVGNVDTVSVDMVMQRPASLNGTISNTSNAPIEAITVFLYQWYLGSETPYWSEVASTVTDANGHYSFSGYELAPGEYRIGFIDYNYAYPTQYYNGKDNVENADTVTLGDGEVKTIDAQLAEYAHITGRVSDANGSGIADVDVYAYRAFVDTSDGSISWSCCSGGGVVTTDANGDYNLILEGGVYRVRFSPHWSSDYQSEYYDNTPDLESANDITVTIGSTVANINAQLSQGGTISGVVTGQDGQPLANTHVSIYTASGFSWVNSTPTDSNGAYSISGLASGVYLVGFGEDNHSTEYYDNQPSLTTATPLTITTDTIWDNINAQLSPLSQIAGTVFGPDGTPLANQYVRLYRNYGTPESPDWYQTNSTYTDAEGNYTFSSINAGVYRIKFESDLYQDEYYNDKPTLESADDIVVQLGETRGGINAQLAAGGEISGLVTNDLGQSIAHTVTFYRQQVNPDSSVSWVYNGYKSSADGNYSIKGVIAGTYRLGFSASCCSTIYYPNAQNIEQASNVVVGHQATVPNINVQLPRNGAISGTVVDDAGVPLTNIDVTIYKRVVASDNSVSWQYLDSGWSTGGNGEYLIDNLAVGLYRLRFSDWTGVHLSSYYSGTAEFETAKNVAVTSGNTTSNINTMLISNGRINGTVRNSNGDGLGAMTAMLYEDYGYGWVHTYSAQTGNDGAFSIKLTRPGSYRIGFADTNGFYAHSYYTSAGSANSIQEAETITLTGKETITLNDVELSIAGSISGIVRNSENAPLANIAVRAYRAGSSTSETIGSIGFTDSNGFYQITGLNAGNYHLYFSGNDNTYGTRFYTNAITVGLASAVAVIIEQDIPNTDMVLPFAVAPVGQVESTVAQVSSDPNTGELTISMGWAESQDITMVRNVSCPNDAPINVTLSGGAKIYPMSENPTGSGIYKVVIPQADFGALNGESLVLTYDCIDPITSTPEPAPPTKMGKIVLYDPSGFVTDADTGEPIVGATARLYNVPGWQPRTGPGDTRENTCQSHASKGADDPWSQPAPVALGVLEVVGSGRMSPDVNPQITNSLGRYAWDVAEGCWYVRVEAAGYLPVVSAVVGVPPEVTDLDLTMERSTVAAAFSANPIVGTSPLIVSFSDESMGPVSTWEWHFGDGATATVENPVHTYTEPGIYSVWLKVTGPEDSHIFTRTTYILVLDTPISGLVANNNGPTTLGNATLLNAEISAGTNASYVWSFGDGTSGTGKNASHTYTSPGSYTAVVTATNPVNSVSVSTTVNVLDVAIGTLDLQGPATIILGEVATFTVTASSGTNVAFVWDFGGGSSGQSLIAAISLNNVTHVFDQVGTYLVKVIATNSNGTKEITKNFVVKDVAIGGVAIAHAGTAQAGQSTTFRASTVVGTNVTYSWKLGDGTTATGPEVVHSYATPGSYIVEVTASNSNNSQVATANFIVTEGTSTPGDTPITWLTIQSGTPQLDSPISFEAKVATGSNVVYTWDFGDGATASGQSVSHTYTAPGTYRVQVTAKNSANQLTAFTEIMIDETGGNTVEAISGLSAAGPSQAWVGNLVKFNAGVTSGEGVVYTWDFGDGNSATGDAVTHIFTSSGRFTITVTASNEMGSKELTLPIEVQYGNFLPSLAKK